MAKRKQDNRGDEVVPTIHGTRTRRPLNNDIDRLLILLLLITALSVMKVLIHDAHILEHHDLQHIGRPVLRLPTLILKAY